jgi:small GTP-binding protein
MEDLTCEFIPDSSSYDLNFKLIIIGDAGVGKSCLTTRATKDYFEENYSTTIGFEFFSLNIKVNEKTIKLQIWDTCGQEIYRSLISSFYRNSSLAFLVYSIDNIESFNNLTNWLNDLKNQSNPDIKIFLIGNKEDLNDDRKILFEDGEKFTKDNNFDLFFETSAKSGFNSKKVFMEAAKLLYLEHLKYNNRSQRSGTLADVIPIEDNAKNHSDQNKRNINQGCC